MKSYDILNLTLSGLAIFLSSFTFYWTSLRKKCDIYYVTTNSLWLSRIPQFALVNAGNSDVLITEIRCYFDSNDPSEGIYIPHRNIYSNNFDQLLLAGKSVSTSIEFQESFDNAFVHAGKQEFQFYYRQLYIEISWLDMNGELSNVRCAHSILGLDEEGVIRVRKPITRKVNLFTEAYLSKYRYKYSRLFLPKYWLFKIFYS